MIEILRNGKTVTLRAKPGHPVSDMTFDFTFTVETEWAATFLVWSLRERLGKELRTARERSYKQGWREAKAKKGAKETWFSSVWERE